MDFTTLSFLGFLMTVTIAYNVCPAKGRVLLLASASYAYYCTWNVKGAILLLVTTSAAYLAARAIEAARSNQRRICILRISLIGLLVPLAAFKLAPFLREILHQPLWIQLGISYYTFKAISYVMDVFWKEIPAERNYISFVAFLAFFPQLVAGPIQRSESFVCQIKKAQRADWHCVIWGIQRVLLGLFKKFMVADNLGVLVNYIYSHIGATGTPMVLGFYLYPLQLYADFSGLTDIAIGAASMIGIRSPENFEAPFISPNPTVFWRRWHITLSALLMDYVYTPLRMATRNMGNTGLVLSIYITMLLIGLWHGFRWTYVLFGLIHGTYIAVDGLTSRTRKRYYKVHPTIGKMTDWFGPLAMFHLVALSFIFFRAETVSDAFNLLHHVGSGIESWSAEFNKLISMDGRRILVGLAGYAVIEIADCLRRHGSQGDCIRFMSPWKRWMVYYSTITAAVIFTLLMTGLQVTRVTFIYAMF